MAGHSSAPRAATPLGGTGFMGSPPGIGAGAAGWPRSRGSSVPCAGGSVASSPWTIQALRDQALQGSFRAAPPRQTEVSYDWNRNERGGPVRAPPPTSALGFAAAAAAASDARNRGLGQRCPPSYAHRYQGREDYGDSGAWSRGNYVGASTSATPSSPSRPRTPLRPASPKRQPPQSGPGALGSGRRGASGVFVGGRGSDDRFHDDDFWKEVPPGAVPPRPPIPTVPAVLPGEDDEDFALQEAIRASLEDAEECRRLELEEAAAAADAAEAAEAAELADAAEAADAAAQALQAAEEAEQAEEEEKLRQSQDEASKRQRPLPPPPGLAESFAPGEWLTDASLACVYACLTAGSGPGSSQEAPPSGGACSSTALPEVVLLMDPATAFWFAVQDNESHLAEAKDALKLQDRELVICPINDSSGSRFDAGTHWTLLVCWDRRCPQKQNSTGHCNVSAGANDLGLFGRFSHYDSLQPNMYGSKGASFHQAEMVASRLAGRTVQVSIGSCARQTNGFDCGVYVLLFSEIVAHSFLEARSRGSSCTTFETPSSGAPPFGRSLSLGHGRHAARMAPEPAWEKRLMAVTPEQVDDCRNEYFRAFTQASSLAAAGA